MQTASLPEARRAGRAPTRPDARDPLVVRALRAVLRALLHTRYRFRVHHPERVPREGAALLVHNHVTVIDWLLVAVACPRVPRFVIHHRDYDRPGLRWFFDAFGAIPIAPRKEDPALLVRAYARIDEALAHGELVALCPEGIMTPDGTMQPFRAGAARVIARRAVPVVPLALRGLWGSLFSRARTGRPFRLGRPRVEVAFGEPIAPDAATTPTLCARIADLLRR